MKECNISVIQYFAQMGQVAARGSLSDRMKYDNDIHEFVYLYRTYRDNNTEGDWQRLVDWCTNRGVYVYAEQWHDGMKWLAIDLMAKWLEV